MLVLSTKDNIDRLLKMQSTIRNPFCMP